MSDRMRSLRTLLQMQEGFEASVKDMLGGLGDLWAQLEELHTRVTLTKQRSRGHIDLASAQTDAEVSRFEGLSAALWCWLFCLEQQHHLQLF